MKSSKVEGDKPVKEPKLRPALKRATATTRSFFRRRRSDLLEVLAVVAVGVLLAHFFDPWWMLVPFAVYLFFLSWYLDRGKR